MAEETQADAATAITCPTCGHVAEWTGSGSWKAQIVGCDACGQRIAYGVPIPRITVVPHPEDARFLVFTFDHRVPGKEARFSVTVDGVKGLEFAATVRMLTS